MSYFTRLRYFLHDDFDNDNEDPLGKEDLIAFQIEGFPVFKDINTLYEISPLPNLPGDFSAFGYGLDKKLFLIKEKQCLEKKPLSKMFM